MRFSVWPSPQNPWSEIVGVVAHAERTGWDGVYFADHFMPNSDDVSAPVHECWTVLAGLAASVPRLRLAALVAGNTYRHPAVVAKMAATIDHISGGRLTLGLGAGWQENEHTAYGIDFFTTRERLDRLEEACEVVNGLLRQPRTDFDGRFYRLTEAPLEPKPVQDKLPLLVGGGGEKVTMRIAAKHADQWNVWSTPEVFAHKVGVLERHCSELGRDPSEIHRSTQALLMMSDDQEFLASRRAAAIAMPTVIGTPAEVVDRIGQYREAGVQEFIVPDFSLGSPERKRDELDRFIEEVAPAFR